MKIFDDKLPDELWRGIYLYLGNDIPTLKIALRINKLEGFLQKMGDFLYERN